MKRVSVISGCVTVLILLMAGHGTRAAMCLPPPVGLVNWWPATGSANDIVGTNHGTLRNGTTFATGVVGQAFSFDGANDFIQIGGTPIAPPWTAEFWVNRQASLEDSAVLIGDTNTALKLEQYPNTKKVGFTKWGLPGGDCSFNYTAPTNTWVHLVFVGNSNNTQLYVNGALQGTNPTNAPFALPRGQMGRDITNRYTKQLRGLVDEPSLYLRALASNEIAALYTAGVAGKCDNYSTNQPLAIFGWGYNYFGQIDPPPGLTNIQAIAAASSFSMALLGNGTVKAWGYGPTNIPTDLSNVVAIAAGSSHSLALLSNKTVRAWGSGSATNVPPGLSNVTAIAAGFAHSLALSNGMVRAWGSGLATNVPAELSAVKAIAANGYYSMALGSNGIVVAWGNNFSGETNVPFGLSNVTAIAAGGSHSMALRSNGTVIAWGANSSGQTNVPAGLSNVMAIAAGGEHSLALRTDGTAIAWGSNYSGQTNAPFGLSNVVSIAAGWSHNLSLSYSHPLRPTNDAFANAIQISGGAATVTGSNVNATKEPGEPYIAQSESHAGSVWWKWTAPSNGVVNVDTLGSSFIPLLGIETGSIVSSLTEVGYDFGSGGSYSQITNVQVAASQTYYVAVDGYYGQQGNISLTLSYTPAPSNDVCSGAITITDGVDYPVNTTWATSVGDPTSDCGGYAVRGIWFSFAPTVSGIVKVTAPNAEMGVYTGACGFLTNVTCGGGLISFPPSAGTTYKILVGGYQEEIVNTTISVCQSPTISGTSSYSILDSGGIRVFYQVSASGTPPLSYLWSFSDGTNITSSSATISRLFGPFDQFPTSFSVIAANACGSPGTSGPLTPPCGAICLSLGSTVTRVGSAGSGLNNYSLASSCATFNSGGSRWFLMSKLTNAAAIAFVDSAGSAPDTVIGVFRGGIDPANLVPIACGITTNQKPAYVEFETVPNYNYWLAVTTTNSAALRFNYGYNLRFAPKSPGLSNGVLTVRSAPLPSLKFRLEATTNLNATAWTPLLTNNFTGNASATNNILQWVDPSPAAYRQRYFRMVLLP